MLRPAPERAVTLDDEADDKPRYIPVLQPAVTGAF
jgi:hypothetical protein